MLKKRGQGLPINVIIVAVIALIVLVVLIAIFTGRMGGFTGGVKKAVTCENSCKAIGMTGTDDAACTGGKKLPGTYDDATNCCCTKETTTATTSTTTTT